MSASFINSNYIGKIGTSAALACGVLNSGWVNFVAVIAFGSGNVPSSVTDNHSNTYNQIYTVNFSNSLLGGNGCTMTLYYANIGTTASTTVTVTFSSSTTFETLAQWFAGINPTPLTAETSVTNNGTGTSVSSGTTPANATAGDLLFAMAAALDAPSGFFTAGGSYTQMNDSSSEGVTGSLGTTTQYQNAASTTTYSATATLSSSFAWCMALVAVKPATPSPTFVRSYAKFTGSGVSSLTMTSITLTAGDESIICIRYTSATVANPTSVSDNLGNTWALVPSSNIRQAGTNVNLMMYYGKIATGGTATITVSFGASVTTIVLTGAEFTQSGLDQHVTGNTTANNPSVNITPAQGNEMILAYCYDPSNVTVGAGYIDTATVTGTDIQEYMAAGPASIAYQANFVQASSAAYLLVAITLGPTNTDKAASGDAYISPWYNSKTASGDAWIVVPQRSAYGDAYITNPSSIHVGLSYVNLAGTIMFPISSTQGYVSLAGNILQPARLYVLLAGTLVKKNTLSFVNLAGTLQYTVRSYVKLIGTIQNPNTKAAYGDAVISVNIRSYVQLAATFIQKTGTSVGAGGSGGAPGHGFYPPNTYVKLAAWIINPRAGLP